MNKTFANQLLGCTLTTETDTWAVTERLDKLPDETGGFFSVGYRVVAADGTRAFCKAMDYTAAMEADDPAAKLFELTEAYTFERDLLAKCQQKRMDRIVRIVGHGKHTVDAINPFSVVQFLLFELADGDVRQYMKLAQSLDAATAFRTLHHVTTGIAQLHRAGVAHQDLKPSNVMTFAPPAGTRAFVPSAAARTARPMIDAKVGDLGRASDRSRAMPHDVAATVGSRVYAPPERLYGEQAADWGERRAACDLYHIGSLATFLFSGVNVTAAIFEQLPPELWPFELRGPYRGAYRDVLPQVQYAFGVAIRGFAKEVPAGFRDEMVEIVRQLCEPDPRLRGDPRNRVGHKDPYALDQYISRFNRMALYAASQVRA